MKKIKKEVTEDKEIDGIIRYLGKKDEAVTFHQLEDYLGNHGYTELHGRELRKELDYLEDMGYVRSSTEGKGNEREERFYLARRLGGGGRLKRNLQNRFIPLDLSKLVKRIVGSFFLLIGIGFFAYSNWNMTGAVVSLSQTRNSTMIMAFVIFVIGGILLVKSFGKKKSR